MKIQILVDTPTSWMVPYARKMAEKFKSMGHSSTFISSISEIQAGDILALLSCEKIIQEQTLKLNKHNLVVHESDLPKGRGWSPLTWQILEGKMEIPVTLLEANLKVDSGVIYGQEVIKCQGNELIDELREFQAGATAKLLEKFISQYPQVKGVEQVGEATYYPKRTSKDAELDLNKTLLEQIDLLRISDNERYPCYFIYKNQKIVLQVLKG